MRVGLGLSFIFLAVGCSFFVILPHRSYPFTFQWPFKWFPIGAVTNGTAVNLLAGVSLCTVWGQSLSQADVLLAFQIAFLGACTSVLPNRARGFPSLHILLWAGLWPFAERA